MIVRRPSCGRGKAIAVEAMGVDGLNAAGMAAPEVFFSSAKLATRESWTTIDRKLDSLDNFQQRAHLSPGSKGKARRMKARLLFLCFYHPSISTRNAELLQEGGGGGEC